MVCCAIAEADSIKVHTTTNSFFIDRKVLIMIFIFIDKDTTIFVYFPLTALKTIHTCSLFASRKPLNSLNLYSSPVFFTILT